ncbi:MAG: hypothetical protein R2991_10190 [Thermoanaerobaculia bacterium]
MPALEALHPRLSTARALLRRTGERLGEVVASGVERLDRPLGGGLPRGDLTEGSSAAVPAAASPPSSPCWPPSAPAARR